MELPSQPQTQPALRPSLWCWGRDAANPFLQGQLPGRVVGWAGGETVRPEGEGGLELSLLPAVLLGTTQPGLLTLAMAPHFGYQFWLFPAPPKPAPLHSRKTPEPVV